MKKDIKINLNNDDSNELKRVKENSLELALLLIVVIGALVAVIVSVTSMIGTKANRYAYVMLPTGALAQGHVDHCIEYKNGKIEITIDGVTYETDMTNVIIVNEGE